MLNLIACLFSLIDYGNSFNDYWNNGPNCIIIQCHVSFGTASSVLLLFHWNSEITMACISFTPVKIMKTRTYTTYSINRVIAYSVNSYPCQHVRLLFWLSSWKENQHFPTLLSEVFLPQQVPPIHKNKSKETFFFIFYFQLNNRHLSCVS